MPSTRFLFAAVFAGTASIAAAQGQPAKPITPVEVVATRVPKSTHDVAASVEVISGDQLRARGARTLKDALALATGVSIAPGGDAGPASAVPEIWGLREFDAFLLVVDGIPWGGALNPAVATLNMRDIDHIEVLRGPAPVTYGATSFVGVISVVHRSGAEKITTIAASGGSYGTGAAALSMGIPVGASLMSRLSVDYDKTGYADDRTASSKVNALWRLSKGEGDTRHWLTAGINIVKQDPASPHPREGPALSTQTPLDANYNPDGAYLNENRFNISAGGAHHLLGGLWGTMVSYTHSEQKMFRGFLTDISNNPNNASGWLENIDLNDIYGDTHIIWPMKNKWQFMAGADILIASGEAKGATFTYTVPLSGATATHVNEPTTLDKDSENERTFFGAYGSAEWMPLHNLSIDAGIRMNSTSEKRGESSPSSTNNKLSSSLGAILGLWESGENHLKAFVNYRNTFKPAAFDFGLAENEGILKPETSTNYEAGVKMELMDGKVGVELSYFNMDFENLVTATIVNGQPALANGGKTKFTGFELATDWQFGNATSARVTYSSHDGKFGDYVQDFGGTLTQLEGKRMEMSAKSLASAGIVYAPATGLSANVSMNYVGEYFLNKRNTAPGDAYSTFDAGVGYRMNRWEFRIDGRNLGDRRDPVAESEFGDAQYYRMPAKSVRAGVVIRY